MKRQPPGLAIQILPRTARKEKTITILLKAFIVLLLAALVFGGGGYFVYDALHPYRNLRGQGKQPVAYVPPIVGEIGKAEKLRAEGKLREAQELLRRQLRLYGKRPEAKAARELLGKINTEMFFSNKVPFGKTQYIVERGDSLWRIAHKLDTTPEVIRRTNNLESSRLQPGDRLWIPTAEFTITLDLPNERVVVHTGDGFFKQYPLLAINLPRPIRGPIRTSITGVTFWKDGAEVRAPTEIERGAAIPWLHLAKGGYVLYGVSEEEGVSEGSVAIGESDQPSRDAHPSPRGFALHAEDLLELQLLIERGTPVTIIAQQQ